LLYTSLDLKQLSCRGNAKHCSEKLYESQGSGKFQKVMKHDITCVLLRRYQVSKPTHYKTRYKTAFFTSRWETVFIK